MQKAEPQPAKVQNQPASQQRGGGVADSPQAEQIAQLEAMVAASSHQAALQKMADGMHNSLRQRTAQNFLEGINNSPKMVAQRMRHEQMFGVAQLEKQAEAKPNNTGLPDNLKSGIENLSGMSMDNVKVHYNSDQPAQLNALAYAQGSDIHLAPGQEQHLPHEAWHVVQQAQGRVQPTMQMKEGMLVNDDKGLEHEADVMGAKALSPAAQLKGGHAEERLLQGKLAPAQRPELKQGASALKETASLRKRSDQANTFCCLQRKIERGSNTGWGGLWWVTDGKALWGQIDKGFNVDLFALQTDLQAQKPTTEAIDSVLESINTFIKFWDGRDQIYYAANPERNQPISAAELAEKIDAELTGGRQALEAAKESASMRETKTGPSDVALKEKKTRVKKGNATANPRVSGSTKGEARVTDIPVSITSATKQPDVSPTRVNPSVKPKATTVKPPRGPSAKELEAARQEERRQANAVKKAENAERQTSVANFGKILSEKTNSLITSEKINQWQTWSGELDTLVTKAKQNPNLEPALKKLYDEWTKKLVEKREANEIERRGTKKQWETWTGLNDYRVIENLPGAIFTPARAPTQGPMTEQGEGPAEQNEAPAPLEIHVTYDTNSVRAPTDSINGMAAPLLVDHLLSTYSVWQRIHGSLETSYGPPYPHIYWGGDDLGLGAARYSQWNAMPEGWLPGPEGAVAKTKVESVLNDYVADNIVPLVQSHLSSVMFKVYVWPMFAELNSPSNKEVVK